MGIFQTLSSMHCNFWHCPPVLCLTTLSYLAASIIGENRGISRLREKVPLLTSFPAAKEVCYFKYMPYTLSCITYVLLSRLCVLTFTVWIFQK